MKKKINNILKILFFITIWGCEQSPKAINYYELNKKNVLLCSIPNQFDLAAIENYPAIIHTSCDTIFASEVIAIDLRNNKKYRIINLQEYDIKIPYLILFKLRDSLGKNIIYMLPRESIYKDSILRTIVGSVVTMKE